MGATDTDAGRLRIAVVGAGPGGICMTIKLKEAGFDDVVVIERNDDVGGTWYLNRYPGCACDVASDLYSFSFAVKTDWSRPYAPQPEILEYMQTLASEHGVLPHCRFGRSVEGASWDDERSVWTVRLDSEESLEVDVLISAIGMFNELAEPAIPGLDTFAGTVFHSARWRWDHDLAGERVAVIGSAASAVQFVPEIVKTAAQVHLFQRTANWVLPKPDTPYTPEELAARRADPTIVLERRAELMRTMNEGMLFSDPVLNAEREGYGLAAMQVVEDPVVRAKLRPDHPFGCKRPLFSNDYYAAFNRPNLELVTDHIDRITEHGVVTQDGRERLVDTIVLATGFAATRYLSAIDVVGRGGRHIVDAWNDGATAYLGITTAGFPNLFMLYGPNTNNGSILTMLEMQADHVVAHLRRLRDEQLAWVDVKADVQDRYNAEVQAAMDDVTVWNAGCNGYYRTPSGRVVTQWPFTMIEYGRRTAQLDPEDYATAPA